MSGREGERRRLGLGFATLLSVILHVLLSVLMAVLTLRHEPSGVDRKLGWARPEAKTKRSTSDFEIIVAKEEPPRPVHESPLDVTVEGPSLRASPSERPMPVDRVVSPKIAQAEPVESPVAVELPRAAAAPKHAIDTPSKLSRRESDSGSQTAETDIPVRLPKSVTSSAPPDEATVEPSPAIARPRAKPRSASPTVSAARPRVDAAKAAEPAAPPRRSSPLSVAGEPQEGSPIARAVTDADAIEPLEANVAAVEPLSIAAESSVERPNVASPAAAARTRPRSSTAASPLVASKASRSGGADAGPAAAGPVRVVRPGIVDESMPTDAIGPLARAGGTAAGVDADAGAEPLAGLAVGPTEPPGGDEPAESPLPSAPSRRATTARRAAPRGGQSSAASWRKIGRGGAAAGDATVEQALTAVVGGRVRGIEGGRGEVESMEADASSPSRRTIEAAGDVETVVVAADLADADKANTVPAAEPAADPFAAIALNARPMRQPRGGPRPAVRIRGPEGPGGTEDEAGPQPGITGRTARRPTEAVIENDERFLARVAAAALSVDGRVRQTAAPFMQRSPERRDELRRGNRGSETEAAIERGLEFLARAQLPDGRWSLSRFPGATPADVGSIASDSAATGLALLCFLGAGHDHFGETHAGTVRRGLEFLRAVQKPDGDLYLETDVASTSSARLYTHAIATMSLCEAVGMTGDPLVRESAAKACRFIASSQHEKRGGWRYAPGVGSDLSVSGWMLLALRSAQLAGVDVDRRCLAGVRVLLDTSQSTGDPDAYVYNPFAPDTPEQRAGRSPSPTMTAVGLLMRLHTGVARDDPRMVRAAAKLAADLPAFGSRTRPARDCYLWYYAAQTLFHVGGDAWDRWYGRLHELLVASQETGGDRAGSWDPGGAVPDRWAAFGGRIYVTTLNLLTLEVSYRHLPLYEVLGPPREDRPPGRSSP